MTVGTLIYALTPTNKRLYLWKLKLRNSRRIMAAGSNGQENATSSVERTDEKCKTPRHPRWTRQETLVLIEGKRIAEERGRKGHFEPKWDAVSSFCKQNGVNRGPVQCRKRWSNLVSDFKKVKTWETKINGGGESFWVMRSDLKRGRKLPGFFDREIYDVLYGKPRSGEYELALVTVDADENYGGGLDEAEGDDDDEMVEDEGGGVGGLFSELEQVAREENGRSPQEERVLKDGKTKTIPSPVPISEMKYQPFHRADTNQANKRCGGPHFWRASEFQEGVKRRRGCQNVDVEVEEDILIKALERNTNLLNAQFEDQKLNWQLDRQQRKEQHDSLITSLSKITEALEKIANKL